MKPRESTTPRPLVDLLIVAVGLVVLGLDQWTKSLAVLNLGPAAAQHSVEVLGDFFRFSYTTNTGAAFGMLQGGTVLFTVIAIAAVPLFVLSPRLIGTSSLFVRGTLGLLLGGALGNLVDRIHLGHVVDFVDVGVGSTRFWTFNVADSAFVVGVALLAIYMLFFAPPDEQADDSAPAAPTLDQREG